jgi:nucleotide-binding universal stress UspA family protein
MIERILLAVDDSPASLAATRLAAPLAARLGADLRVVHVAMDHELGVALARASDRPHVQDRVVQARTALLTRVASLAAASGAAPETALLAGEVAPALLADAREWAADLIVIGRSARASGGHRYVGSQAREVLEFAEVPVVVVPPPRRAAT